MEQQVSQVRAKTLHATNNNEQRKSTNEFTAHFARSGSAQLLDIGEDRELERRGLLRPALLWCQT